MKEVFGYTENNETVWLYTIENDSLIMKVTNFGAALVSFIDRKTGIDVVKGYGNAEGFIKGTAYLGASVGRVANRIKDGKFTLNGKEYLLPVNNGTNSLHGGVKGFSYVLYEAETTPFSVTFTRTSPDGEEGYPGTLEYSITYALDGNGILITAEGKSDADTLFGYTNHTYFNADDSGSILDQKLCVKTDVYSPQDETNVTLCEDVPAEGTPFDFRTPHPIGDRIADDDEQLKIAAGYDHWYPVRGSGMREMAVLSGKKLDVIVSSDLPGIHVYTSNWFSGETDKYGKPMPARCSVALETSFRPNAVNYPDEKNVPLLRAGETAVQHIRFRIRQR